MVQYRRYPSYSRSSNAHLRMTAQLNYTPTTSEVYGASLTCKKLTDWIDEEYDEYAECTWLIHWEDWEDYDEIIISEGPNTNLCDGSNDGCTVDITLTKIGIGGEDNRIIAEISAYADAN